MRLTDGQTDSFLITRPRVHSMQRSKNKFPVKSDMADGAQTGRGKSLNPDRGVDSPISLKLITWPHYVREGCEASEFVG